MTTTTAAAAAAKALQTPPPASPPNTTSSTAERPRNAAMRRLWERMAAIYGHRWTSAFGLSAEVKGDDGALSLAVTGDTWARGLSGISEAQIAAGLNRCITSADPWPPTVPEFRARCIGIPDLAVVALELDTAITHPFAAMVGRRIDWYRYKRSTASEAGHMLREAYGIVREEVMKSAQIDPLPPMLEAGPPEPRKPADPDVASAALERMRALYRQPGDEAAA